MKKYIMHNKLRFSLLVFLKMLNTFVFLYFSFIIKDVINSALTDGRQKLWEYVVFGIVYSVILVICFVMVASVHSYYVNRCMYLMKKDYIDKLFMMPYEKIVKKESSSYISAMTNDINMVRNGYIEQIFAIMDSVISIVLASGYILYINPKIFLFVIISAVVLPFCPILMEDQLFKADEELSNANEQYVSNLKGILSGVDVIKTFSCSRNMLGRVYGSMDEQRKKSIHNDMLSIKLSSLSTTVMNVIKFGIVILGGYYVSKGSMDVGSVTALFVLSSSFLNPIMSLCYQVGNIMGSKAVVQKINEVLGEDTGKKQLTDKKLDSIDEIVLDNITYSYNEKQTVLHDLSVKFEKNKKYLVIGESGAGKSTIIKLLLKMYTNYEGTITLNGINYESIDDETVFRHFGYAQQRSIVFNGTLRENIDINGVGDEERLMRCIKQCRLEKFVGSLEKGVDTVIGEELNRISEGEKLRICLARTLYKESESLLLDEVTASLDLSNSLEIEKMIVGFEDKMIINICHKFDKEIAEMYNSIIIVENGRVVLTGSYNDIRENEIFCKYLKKG
ncbi:MAG: ABC transporter ATP-binding protein [Ruminococcus sp.]|nr:ABC transporter ATP-binding protein [Ruminococcus sp.]